MFSQEGTITTPNGLHTRAAAQFVKEANIFTSNVTVSDGRKTVNGKKLFPLQTLALSQGNTLTITAEGEDEQNAVEHLCKLLAELD